MSQLSSLAPVAGPMPPDPRTVPAIAPAVTVVTPASAVRNVADGADESAQPLPGAGADGHAGPGGAATDSAALEAINQALAVATIGLRFEFDQESARTIVRVVDIGSGEVIRQMPSEEALHMSKTLDKLQGLIFQREA